LEDRKNFSWVENCPNPYQTLTTPHQSANEKGQKMDSTRNSRKRMRTNHERKIPLNGNLHGQLLRNELEIIPTMNIPTRRKLTKVSQKMWLKNKRGKNNAPIAPSGTTPGENVENQL